MFWEWNSTFSLKLGVRWIIAIFYWIHLKSSISIGFLPYSTFNLHPIFSPLRQQLSGVRSHISESIFTNQLFNVLEQPSWKKTSTTRSFKITKVLCFCLVQLCVLCFYFAYFKCVFMVFDKMLQRDLNDDNGFLKCGLC